jgi:hypothetical protein
LALIYYSATIDDDDEDDDVLLVEDTFKTKLSNPGTPTKPRSSRNEEELIKTIMQLKNTSESIIISIIIIIMFLSSHVFIPANNNALQCQFPANLNLTNCVATTTVTTITPVHEEDPFRLSMWVGGWGGVWFLIITKMHFLPLNQDISAHHFVFAAFDEEGETATDSSFCTHLRYFIALSLLTSSAITTCPLSSSGFHSMWEGVPETRNFQTTNNLCVCEVKVHKIL